MVADGRHPVQRRVAIAGGLLGLGQADRIGLGVDKAEEIGRGDVSAELPEATLVQQLIEALAHGDAEVVIALGADLEVPLQPLVVDESVAGRALCPALVLGDLWWRSHVLHRYAFPERAIPSPRGRGLG